MYEKESLSSVGQQFYQYRQNEQSPLIITELTEHKRSTTYDIGNSGPSLGQEQKCDRVKPVKGIPILPS